MESFKLVISIRDPFPFYIIRLHDKSSNVPSNTVYSANGTESLRISGASSNPDSISKVIKPLATQMSKKNIEK